MLTVDFLLGILFEDPASDDRPKANCGPLQCVNCRTWGQQMHAESATVSLDPTEIVACRTLVSMGLDFTQPSTRGPEGAQCGGVALHGLVSMSGLGDSTVSAGASSDHRATKGGKGSHCLPGT